MESSVSPKLLLALLLLVAPVLQLQARQLGGSQEQHGGGGLPLVLVLPSGSDDDGVVVPSKLNALPGVSGRGRVTPPAPRPPPYPHPRHEPSPHVVSSPGVTGNQKRDDDDGAVVPPKLNALPGVSGRRGVPPPAPRLPPYPHPGHEPSPHVVSSPGVTGNHKVTPPPPVGNPPGRPVTSAAWVRRRTCSACSAWDALVRVVWLLLREQNSEDSMSKILLA